MSEETKAPRPCPKCGQFPDSYTELWAGFTSNFPADKNGVPEEIGYHDEGHPYGVIANCRCGNSWRLRGILQITELHPEPRPSQEGSGKP